MHSNRPFQAGFFFFLANGACLGERRLFSMLADRNRCFPLLPLMRYPTHLIPVELFIQAHANDTGTGVADSAHRIFCPRKILNRSCRRIEHAHTIREFFWTPGQFWRYLYVFPTATSAFSRLPYTTSSSAAPASIRQKYPDDNSVRKK